jgi:hypothetical protein
MWHVGVDVASYCAAMCHLGSNSLLMCFVATVPCGISLMRWPSVAVPCGISWDEVDHWLTATWHYGGTHLSVTCARVGPIC